MAVDETAISPGSVRVLARWNDPGRSPAILERVVGDGRVLLWTTSADRAGNDWPVEPSFVLAVREAIRGTSRPTSCDHTVTAGDRPRRVVHSSQQVGNVRLTPPGGGEPKALAAVTFDDKASGDATPASAIELPDTRKAGLYRLAWDEGALGTQADLFASNPDPRESGLDRLDRRRPEEAAGPPGRRGRRPEGGRHRRPGGHRARSLARDGLGPARPPAPGTDPRRVGGGRDDPMNRSCAEPATVVRVPFGQPRGRCHPVRMRPAPEFVRNRTTSSLADVHEPDLAINPGIDPRPASPNRAARGWS